MREYRVQNTEYRPNMNLSAKRSVSVAVWLLTVLCTVFFTACRPKGVLSSRQMRAVIVDLHKTDAMLHVSGLQYGHKEEKGFYYALTLEKHGVTQAQFDSSLVWYTAHPQLFDKIYPKVLAQLEAEEAAFKELHADELGPLRANERASSRREISTYEAQNYTDSVLWVSQHGYPSTWHPWPKPFRLFP